MLVAAVVWETRLGTEAGAINQSISELSERVVVVGLMREMTSEVLAKLERRTPITPGHPSQIGT